MKQWAARQWQSSVVRWLGVAALAAAMVAAGAAWESARPVSAAMGAAAGPTASPIDDGSVSALLALDRAMETVAARVTPAVVNVSVTSRSKAQVPAMGGDDGDMQQFFRQFFGGPGQGRIQIQPQPRVERGMGSGVIISPDGYIVTNNHVVDGASEIRVTMSDRRVLTAKLVGSDALTDLAVIKVSGSNLPNAPWGDSSALHPGHTVLAFGNPYGMRFTVTRGIVSAVHRANPFADNPRRPNEYIQTDAAINPGNSGGALVNARGEVIGINTFLISPSGTFSGMGFAIQTQVVKPTVEALIRDGKVRHAYIGVSINDVTPENAQFFHLTDNDGALVASVEANSPGARAGLKVGDVITALDGEKVSDAGALQVAVGQRRPGTKVELGVVRDGKTLTVPVTLEELNARSEANESSGGEEHGKGRWGLSLDNLTPDLKQQLQAPGGVHGAVVTSVEPGSSADDAGLARGNVIQEINRQPVQSAADAQRLLSSIAEGKDALALVWANGGSSFRVLHAPSK